MPCYSPLSAFQRPNGEVVFAERGDIARRLDLPCGRCIGCRLERARQWAVRCVHESKLHSANCFITLTYDQEHLPPFGSLCYRDFQLFMKRLRARFRVRIRFFMCGEYGDSFNRPHYHALLFGLSFPDARPVNLIHARSKVLRSAVLDELWPLGFASIGELNYESAGYVARYSLKKVAGPLMEDHYRVVDPDTGEIGYRVPEFGRMSLKPGIGFEWFSRYRRDYYPRGEVIVNGKASKPPRYYDRIFSKVEGDPGLVDEVFWKRALRGMEHPEEQTPERLAVRAQVAAALPKLLKGVL